MAVCGVWILTKPKFFNRNLFKKCFSSHKSYEIVIPGKVSSVVEFPETIAKPSMVLINNPQIRSINDMTRMRESCQSARKVLDFVCQLVRVGVTTEMLDQAVNEKCMELGVYPSPLGYKGFPKSVCTSVNNVVCHGIPDDRRLIDGDMINIDITVFQNGFHGDCSRTVFVGSVDEAGCALADASEACLAAGISVCCDGVSLSKIGEAVEEEAARRGFQVIPYVAGHGVGHQFHEPPDVYHFEGAPDCGIMHSGMTFTIEPAVTEGSYEIQTLDDGWTTVTVDGSRSAQTEHTILITDNGAEILTVGRQW